MILQKKIKKEWIIFTNHKPLLKKQHDDAVANYEIAQAKLNSAKENFRKVKNLARPEELKQGEANLNRAIANVNILQKNLNDCYVTITIFRFHYQEIC